MKVTRVLASYLFFVVLLIALLVSGCGGDNGEATLTRSPLSTPESEIISSSPVQTPSPELLNWNAEPAPGKAVLRGRVEITESTILLGELYLAKAVPTDKEGVDLLELDEDKSPRASINRDTGEFIFLNVEPGKYGLIAWEPENSFPINDPDTGKTLFIELSAGQVVDVGQLYLR